MAERMTPLYKDLPVIEQTGYRHAWGVFGDGDELGTIARLTPERIARAARTVRRGAVFNLSLPLNEPDPPIVERRKPYRHEIVEPERNSRDDKIDDLWNQASSQIDALSHMRYREFGFYNGLEKAAVDGGALGIDRWADHGIVGRGLLLDMPRYFASRGEPFDPSRDTAWQPDVLEAALAAQGVEPEEGDMLLLRTGWMAHYFSLSAEQRAALPQHLGPGRAGEPGTERGRGERRPSCGTRDSRWSPPTTSPSRTRRAAPSPAFSTDGSSRSSAWPWESSGRSRRWPTTARKMASTSAWSSPSPSTCRGVSARRPTPSPSSSRRCSRIAAHEDRRHLRHP